MAGSRERTDILCVHLVGCFVVDGLEHLAESAPVGIEVDQKDILALWRSGEQTNKQTNKQINKQVSS